MGLRDLALQEFCLWRFSRWGVEGRGGWDGGGGGMERGGRGFFVGMGWGMWLGYCVGETGDFMGCEAVRY